MGTHGIARRWLRSNEAGTAFRLRRAHGPHGALLGLLLGAALGHALFADAPAAVVPLSGLGLLVGLLFGLRLRSDRCAEPACDAHLSSSMRVCPGCGGVLVGEIRSRRGRARALAWLSAREEAAGRKVLSEVRLAGFRIEEDEPFARPAPDEPDEPRPAPPKQRTSRE